MAEALKERWGQSVMVENRTGASGMLAAEQVVRSAPDGYTLLVSPQTSIAVAPQIFAKSPYDPLKDLTPITILTATPMLLVAHPSFPASNFAEFLAYACGQPGQGHLCLRRHRFLATHDVRTAQHEPSISSPCTCPTAASSPRSPT